MEAARKMILDRMGAIVAEKRQRVQMLGMMNANTDEVTRMRQSIEYSQALANLANAEADLRAEMSKG
jgi:putative aminopeptidase FrvX